MKVFLDPGAIIPTRAHSADAGLDLYSRESSVIPAGGSACFDTGVHVEIPNGYAGFLKSKSGLNVKHGLISDGTIDSGYTGSIVVKLYNLSEQDYEVKSGDKITQLVVCPVILEGVEIFERLQESERGSNGFGSTGR